MLASGPRCSPLSARRSACGGSPPSSSTASRARPGSSRAASRSPGRGRSARPPGSGSPPPTEVCPTSVLRFRDRRKEATGLMSERELHEVLLIEEADAWFEYADATKGQQGTRYTEIEPWAWSRLQQRLRAVG